MVHNGINGEEQARPTTPTSASYQSAKQGIAWLLTTPGAPMLYMGDEFGQHGGADLIIGECSISILMMVSKT